MRHRRAVGGIAHTYADEDLYDRINHRATEALARTAARARRQTFIVSDPTPVTVADLIARYRAGFGRPAWLFPAPELLFELALSAAGQTPIWQRIGCPLLARPDKLLAFGWNPVEFSRLGLAGK